MPLFRLQAIQQLHYDKDYPLWEYDRRAMACTFCHVKDTGGPPWNSFGEALRAQFVADAAAEQHQLPELDALKKAGQQKTQQGQFAQVLYDLLKADKDSDGDGYPDALEIFAHTLPGDSSSKPTQPVAELEKVFEAAGGVWQYAPGTAASNR